MSEESFRQHLVDLERRTNAVPADPQTFPLDHDGQAKRHTLPMRVEQQVADDFAFLAAIEEGAQSVAAVCLEEHVQPVGITIRFAALDLAFSSEIKSALQHIADSLTLSSRELEIPVQIEATFERIVKLHFRRLLARLRSRKWEKPKYLSKQHKKPLWQDFANLFHRVQFLYTKKESAARRAVEAHVQSLAPSYEAFEASELGSQMEFDSLKDLIQASYRFCKAESVAEFAQRLQGSPSTTPTAKVASAIKCLRQIEKIAAYWRIAASLLSTSRQYPSLFQNDLQLAFLTPYESVPTAIGYEAWATNCHVHAEIQLVVYYDVFFESPDTSQANGSCPSVKDRFRRPRAIGTSKWLCYLCYLFLRCHGCYPPANTHGRLYDQWTVPDLAEYGDQVIARYRTVLHAMDHEVIQETCHTDEVEVSDTVRWRPEPMTSRQNLLNMDRET